MVRFNNKDMKIYDLDTEDTIFKRLASDLNTKVELLYFQDGIPTLEQLYQNTDIIVIDLKNIIENATNIKDIYNFIHKEEDNVEHMLKKLSIFDLISLYITFNNDIKEVARNELMYPGFFKDPKIQEIYNEANELVKKSIDIKNINDIWLRKNAINETLKEEIALNKEEWIDDPEFPKNILAGFKKFENEKELQFTEFEKEKVKFELELNIQNISSILELFNNLKLNSDIPFATTNYFYKIFKEFTPPLEWSNLFDRSKTFYDKYKNIDRNNTIILKVLENKKKDIYSESFIIIEDNKIKVKLEYNINNIKEKDINPEKYNQILIEKILRIFDIEKNSILDERITEVNGVFYFPFETFDKYVMMDLILNDKLFSNLLSINEKRISKKDSVYVYFENTKIGKISATLTPKLVDDIELFKNKELFPKNSEYIRVKINKAENFDKVKYFQSILSKLLSIYGKKQDEITVFYSPFVKINIKKEIEEEEDITEKLEDLEPSLFITGYSSDVCQKKTQPTYISDEEADELLIDKENEKFIIKFPKEQIDDVISRYYSCNSEEYPYPGLKKNKLENNDKFPYLPCCYPVDQTNKKNYRNYYFEEEIEEVKGKFQNVYKTRKILDSGAFGYLPENLNKAFSIVDRTGIYYRRGVDRNQSSFLSCLLVAFNKSTINLRRIRERMSTPEFAASCKQEMYDYDIDKIMEKIKNPNEYLDPKLFLHLLEVYFDCNIFIFVPGDNGKMILPRHIKGYYKNRNEKKCVFIYEHMGSSIDKAEYPQCELIVRQVDEKSEEIEELFDYENIISQNVINIFNKVNTSFILEKKIPFTTLNWPWENILGLTQNIDSYGKTRCINIEFESEKISILTTPIQPLKLNISEEIFNTKITVALRLIQKLKIKNIKQVLDENLYVKELIGNLGNFNVSILIDGKNKKLEDIDISILKTFSNEYKEEKDQSIITEYNKMKKLSRYVIEYMFWLFSKYLNDNNIKLEDIDGNVYKNFKNEYIEINQNFIYENVPKTFSLEDNGIINNKKIIVKSEDSLKRLFYVLRMEQLRNYKKLISYYQNKMIENYYVDITDFDEYNYQVILEGESSIAKLIEEKNDKNLIYDNVHLKEESIDKKVDKDIEDEDDDEEELEKDETEVKDEKSKNKFKKFWNIKPYFFKNNLISTNEIYLAQNIDSYLKAIEIASTWENDKYNPGIDVKESEIQQEFTLYSFVNNKKIKKYVVEGNDNTYDIKILGYKVNFENKKRNLYTVLLPL